MRLRLLFPQEGAREAVPDHPQCNDGPYGSERTYNGLRLGMSLLKQAEAAVRVFLFGDAVQCAVSGQQTPQGYYNVERMIRALASRGAVAT